MRIVVGLSGGVDSAVAALRLLRDGHRVEGLFMKNWEDDDTLTHCSAEADLASAQSVAERLGTPLHRVNFARQYREAVFEQALAELRAGRTPNPDMLCNRHIKFGLFQRHALEQLGADAVATGHYARTVHPGSAPAQLHRGRDPEKDQSYFLAGVAAEALEHAWFPLGGLTKETVREQAREAGLPNSERPDSTGICFIGERDFARFLARYITPSPGPILSPDGTQIGRHQGLAFYTLGQRRGLGIGGAPGFGPQPWYVAAKDPDRNALIAVQGHDHPWLHTVELTTEPFHWLAAPPASGARLEAQVRYRQAPEPGTLEHGSRGTVAFRFDRPQRAATPGQYLVLYDGDRCLGCGAIARTTPADPEAPAPQPTSTREVV